MICADDLRKEELRLRYVEMLERPDIFPTRKNWQFITSNSLSGLASALYRKYIAALHTDDYERQQLHDIALEEFHAYLDAIEFDEACDAIYDNFMLDPVESVSVVKKHNLFDAASLIRLLEDGNIEIVLEILEVYKPYYDENDLCAMSSLLEALDSLPIRGKIVEKQGLLGKSEKYICPAGHVNSRDTEYCTHNGCGKNMRGLTESQENSIMLFGRRIEALESLLKQGSVEGSV